MRLPEIYLAIDNCFASKRWTKPLEWMEVIKDLGVWFVEASADNECDPLYTSIEYLEDWTDEVNKCTSKTGVEVSSLYSGHGTYATLGLAHTDIRIREKFLNEWLKKMVDTCVKVDAGLGFFCHAFPVSVLMDPKAYESYERDLYNKLAELSKYASGKGLKFISLEQMYSPHQIPWTIKGAEKLIKTVSGKDSPFYITIDTGHQSGQRKFLKPDSSRIGEYIKTIKEKREVCGIWLGSEYADKILDDAVNTPELSIESQIIKIEKDMEKYPYLFAEYEDGDTYAWLGKLGCYSPIIHLQQTDGNSSSHRPFTQEYNKTGIIDGGKVLRAIYDSYINGAPDGFPPKCEKLYLTLEVFSGTADYNRDILFRLKKSVEYWRQYIKEDGMRLDEIISQIL